MVKKIIFSLLAVGLLVWAGFTLYSNKQEINEAATYQEEIGNVPVKLLTVKTENYERAFNFTGTFEPNREVNFGAELQGKIAQVLVEEGDFLKAGKTIARLDNSLLKLQLKSQQTQLEITKVNAENQQILAKKNATDLQRFENLRKNEAVADITYQNQKLSAAQTAGTAATGKLNIKAANIAIQTTQEQLSKTAIVAPISGYLTRKNFERGTIVAPNAPLGTITDISQLKLAVMIPQKQVIQFREGQTVNILADVYPDKKWQGTIRQIAAKADANRNFKVEVLIDNRSKETPLKAGMDGTLQVESTQSVAAIFIPNTALVGNANQLQVYVAEDGKAVLRNVKTGISAGNKVAITEGLQVGDQIVVTGINNLDDGVTIAANE